MFVVSTVEVITAVNVFVIACVAGGGQQASAFACVSGVGEAKGSLSEPRGTHSGVAQLKLAKAFFQGGGRVYRGIGYCCVV